MKIVDVIQKTPEWHKFRQEGIGSTDIGAILHKSPYKTALGVYEDKIGVSEPVFVNKNMMRGVEFEDHVCQWLKAHLNCESYTAPCIEHDKYSYFHSSLDFYCEEKNMIAEIKVPSDKNFLARSMDDEIELYKYQLHWHMICSEINEIYFVRYSPPLDEYQIKVVPIDGILVKEMKIAAWKFWADLQKSKMPEDKYPNMAVPEALDACEEYDLLSKEKNSIDKRLKTLKADIMEHVTVSCVLNGISCIETKGRVSYDVKAMKDDGLDLAKYERQGNSFFTVKSKV